MIILTEEHKHVHKEHKHEVKHAEHHKPEHEHVHKGHKHIETKKKVKIKKADMWKILTLALGVLFIISLFTHGFSKKTSAGPTGGVADKQEVVDDALQYINTYLTQGTGSATLKEITEQDDLYVLKLTINNRDYDSYVTKDGKYLFPQGIDMTEERETPETPTQQPTQEVTKSDKPEVEVFIMSHCPFGTQMEKGIIPVMETLGDKADIEIKFVNYAMHGETEVKEQWQQYCIQKEQNNKFLPYLKCFLKEGDGEGCLTEANIDTAALETCKQAADTEFKILESLEKQEGRFPAFLTHDEECKKYGVSGSPTLVINGQKVSSGRDPSSLLTTICGAFNEQPAECDTELSSDNPSAGFGFETTGPATDAQC